MTPPRKAPTKRTATTATKQPDKLRATQTFAAVVDDDVLIVNAGEIVSAKHAVVRGREALFVPVDHE